MSASAISSLEMDSTRRELCGARARVVAVESRVGTTTSASDDFGTVRKLTVNKTGDLYVCTSTVSFLTVQGFQHYRLHILYHAVQYV